MRPWILLAAIGLCAFGPIHNSHDSQGKIDSEFTNLYGQAQPAQFEIVSSTPNLTDMKDGEVVIFSSGAVKMMWRAGQELYAVSGSCITVRR